MDQFRFFKELGILVIASLIVAFLLTWIPAFKDWLSFSVICILIFCILTVVMFMIGNQMIRSKNLLLYSNFSLFYGFFKMLLAVLLLFIYKKYSNIQDHSFVIPFLIFYFVFVAYETRVLMKLGKTKMA